MERHQPARRTRRDFLWTSLHCQWWKTSHRGTDSGYCPGATAATDPSCAEKDDATPSQTEGPYYKRNSPQRTSLLEPGSPARKSL